MIYNAEGSHAGVSYLEENKKRFIELIQGIKREGADIEGLIKKLESSDFFEAPASTKYHSAIKGGLCLHSLNVYDNLSGLIKMKYGEVPFMVYDEDSIRIVSLLHDIAKINTYEVTSVNKKLYTEHGTKSDNLGKFEWVSEMGYRKREDKDVYLFGTHGQNSERMVSYFIPMSEEESCAIVNHHSNYDNHQLNISPIYNKYGLACLLHLADMMSTYIDERVN